MNQVARSPVGEASWLATALKFGGVGAWSWRVDEDVLDYTEELETILGKRDGGERWNYAAFLQAILQEDRERVDRAVQSHLLTGSQYRVTFRIRRTDGHIRWVEGCGEVDQGKTQGSPVMNGILRDITDQKQHEAQFESIVEQTPNVAIQGYDLDGRVLFWNKASERLFGWTAEQAVGKRLEEFLHSEEDAREFRETVAEVLRSRQAHGPCEYSVIKPDGSRTECLSTIFQIADGPTGPAFVCMDVDVSAQKVLSDALQESESKYSNIFLLSPDAIMLIDAATREIVEVNAGFTSIFGFEKEEAVGRTMAELGMWRDLADRDQVVALLTEDRQAVDHEVTLVCRDGSLVHCSVSANLFTHRDKVYFNAVVRDITDRKQTEMKVRESAEWFRSLIEYSSDLIHIVSPDGTLLYESPSALRILGYPESDLGDSVFDFIHPDDRAMVQKAMGQLLECPELPGKAEFRVRTFDGDWLYLDARARNLCGQPGIGGIVVNSRNVTDRYYAEQRTRLQVERLQSLHTIDAAISGSLDLKVTLGVVLSETCRQLRCGGSLVRVLRPDSCMLEVAAEQDARRHGDIGPVHLGAGIAGRAVMEARVLQCEAKHPGDEETPGGDFLHVAAPLIAKGRPNGVLEIWVEKEKVADAEWFSFLEMLAGQTAIAVDHVLMFEEIQRSNLELVLAYDSTIEGWSKALELRDKETEGHTKRVTELSVKLARQMGFSESAIVQVRRGALLHDIGKMGVPDEILLKPDKLTTEEFDTMKKHTEYAFEWLSPIPFLREAIEIPYCHHEKWDGSGYPRGLSREQIPLAARVFAIVDVFDALTSNRPYRQALSVSEALAYIAAQSGSHFDPQVAEAFLHLMQSDRILEKQTA